MTDGILFTGGNGRLSGVNLKETVQAGTSMSMTANASAGASSFGRTGAFGIGQFSSSNMGSIDSMGSSSASEAELWGTGELMFDCATPPSTARYFVTINQSVKRFLEQPVQEEYMNQLRTANILHNDVLANVTDPEKIDLLNWGFKAKIPIIANRESLIQIYVSGINENEIKKVKAKIKPPQGNELLFELLPAKVRSNSSDDLIGIMDENEPTTLRDNPPSHFVVNAEYIVHLFSHSCTLLKTLSIDFVTFNVYCIHNFH